MGHDVDEQRRFRQRQAWPDLAAQAAHQQMGRAPAALALIDVRASAIRHGHVAMIDQALRQVAVQVERDSDGQFAADGTAQAGQHLAVGVEMR